MIIIDQELQVYNCIALRTKIEVIQFDKLATKMEYFLKERNIIKKGPAIIGTHQMVVENGLSLIDVEILQPVDDVHDVVDPFVFKRKFFLSHAVKYSFSGMATGLNDAYKKLNEYILTNRLMPITPTYSITQEQRDMGTSNARISVDLFIGINPNIL